MDYMIRVYESTDKSACKRILDLGSKLLGYPKAGIHVGNGRHVAIGDPPAIGETKPGWTSFDRVIESDNPDNPQIWSIESDAYEAGLVEDDARPAELRRLTSQERAELVMLLMQAKDRVLLANNGSALMNIVTKSSPSVAVGDAAVALAEKLSAITGATFEVTTGDGTTGIVVGLGSDFVWPFSGDFFDLNDPTKTEDYAIKSHSSGVYIGGATDIAVENAIWDFLHKIGYRYFFPGESWEIVPNIPRLSVGLDIYESPDYYSRRIKLGFGTWDDNEPRFSLWNRRNRMRQGVSLVTGHSYSQIESRNQAEFDAHPEYYTELDGVRQTNQGATVKFDISNADLRQLVVDDTLAQFEKTPSPQSVSLDPSDGSGWGNSAAELALGSISDRVVLLANQAAAAVDAVYPNQKYIGIYAYNQHSPPPNISVHHRVGVAVATRFITGGFTADQLVDGWGAKGSVLGIREYYSVNAWDRDIPGKARASSRNLIKTTIPNWHSKGARFMNSESGEGWGAYGLGHYLAARYLWSVAEADNEDALIDDFLIRCFGSAHTIMKEFYNLIDSGNKPLLSQDLLGRMYRYIDAVLSMVDDSTIRRRIYDLALYTRYVELFREFELAKTEEGALQGAGETVLRFAYQIHSTHMVNSYALWRDLPTRYDGLTIPPEAAWNVPEEDNPWKTSDIIPDSEIDSIILNGIANNPLLNFTPLLFSDDLVPATPLNLTSGAGDYNYIRGEHYLYTWADEAPKTIDLTVRGGRSKQTEGDVKLELYPREEPTSTFVDSDQVPPDNTTHPVSLDTNYEGLQALRVTDRSGGYTILPANVGTPFVFEVSLATATNFSGRWTLYFYVPIGTTVVGGYSWGGSANIGSDTLKDGDGTEVFVFPNTAGYWSVPVSEGQDGKVWRFDNCLGKRALMTVPPYVARRASELLLPREVVYG